jgi:hypothetical protein
MDLLAHPYLILGGVITVLILWNYVSAKHSGLRHLPLPPGPKGYPIIGALFDMPTERTWLVYDKWFKIYGTYTIRYSRFCQQYANLDSS